MVLNKNGNPHKLGGGMFGDVYLAQIVKTGVRVAIKMFKDFHSQDLKDIVREMSIAIVAGQSKYVPRCFGAVGVNTPDQTYLPIAMVSEYIGERNISNTITMWELLSQRLTDHTWIDLAYQVINISQYK